jgi:hypothetical protein
MKTIPSLPVRLLLAASICVLTLLSTPASAQATRTWVSGVGDDANPCSRTAPGKTFAGAISKTAAGGEIDVIDAGAFGAVTITKSITIDGQGLMASILFSSTNGVTINAGANDVVTLRNLSLNGAGTGLAGIRVLSAAEVNIENCVIFEATGKGVDIQPTANCRINIKDTIIRGCGAGAIVSTPGAGATAFLTIKDCNLLASTVGLKVDARTKSLLDNCEVIGNNTHGIHLTSTGGASESHITNCIISDNGTTGILAAGASAVARVAHSTITANITGLTKTGGGLLISYGNNRLRANDSNGSFSSTIGQE